MFINLRVVRYSRGLAPYVAGSWYCADEKHPNMTAARKLVADCMVEEPGDWRLETRGTDCGWHEVPTNANS